MESIIDAAPAGAAAAGAAASAVCIYDVVIGGRFAPLYEYMIKYIALLYVDVVKLSIRLIGLTLRQMLCLVSGPSGKPLPEFRNQFYSSEISNGRKIARIAPISMIC